MARQVFIRFMVLVVVVSFSIVITTLTFVKKEHEVAVARFVSDNDINPLATLTPISEEQQRKNQMKRMDLSTQDECDDECQADIQRSRKETIAEQCKALGMPFVNMDNNSTITPTFLKKLDHFLVLDRYKVIYSYIPKAGCTNWKRVFLVLSGRANSTQSIEQKETHILTSKYIRSLNTYTLEEVKHRLKHYAKFTFVRDPFVRLLSAYRDKLEKKNQLNGAFRKDWGKRMKKLTEVFRKYRLRSIDLNTTFHEFIEYLSDPRHNLLDPAEEHWIEMYRLSHPCAINYDFIGRVETLDRDTHYVLKNLVGVPPKKILFRNSTNPTNSSDSKKLQRYFSDVPRKDIKALYDRYAPDFKLFGYENPDILLDSECGCQGNR